MAGKGPLRFDEIGYWSEIKLEILRKYAVAFTTIIGAQARKGPALHPVYIDGFAGAGEHISKTSGGTVPGSPKIALEIVPPFSAYHFVDLDQRRADNLREMSAGRTNVHVHTGDCNQVLTRDVFPLVRYDQYRRGLCLLDPYGLHLHWEVVRAAADTRAVEIYLNFPVADMNRNVFWQNPEGVDPDDIARMTAFWGDDSWRKIAYTPIPTLFGGPVDMKTADNRTIADAYRRRLKEVAGFKYVPEPIPMRNSKNAVVYYLFFASPKAVGEKIVKEIFDRYRNYGVR